MKKKIFITLFAILFIFPAMMLLTACGESSKQVESMFVEFANNQYSITNNQINLEWGEYVSLSEDDFVVKFVYDDESEETVSKATAKKDGYSFVSTLPVRSTPEGKTPVGRYTVTISYRELEKYVLTVNIAKKSVGLPALDWGNTELGYDGTQKTVQIQTELPSYLRVVYQNNQKTDIGNYTATATFVLVDADHYVLTDTTATKDWKIVKGVPTLVAPTAKTDLVYTGEAQELINAGSTTGGTIQYKLNNGEYSTEIPTATNAGNYNIFYKVVDDSNYNGISERSLTVSIAKADSILDSAPTAKEGLVYNGLAQALINAGSATGGALRYKINFYSDMIPTALDARTYTIYYKVFGDSNHKDTEEASLTVTIAKADSTLKSAPTAKADLVYTGEAQALVNAGSAAGGTIYYKLDGGEYSTAIPTATEPGTYTIYYKVVGDTNHNDIPEQSVVATIT